MLLRLALCLWIWALGLVHAQEENDFENSPDMRRVPMKAYTLAPPYLDSDLENRWFDFGGDTVIRSDRYIRLTSDYPSRTGWVFSRVPLTATNWQIEFEFKIHGEGNLHGDGFALWLTKQRASPGPVFGSVDRFEGLGIFFDTYKNGRAGATFPYVLAMMGDGKTTYDQAHDGKANELAGCSARGLRGASVPTKARLTYFQDKYIALDLQYKSENTWTQCFRQPATDDVSINIPTAAYLGFSAETGELSDNHDIVSVSTFSLYNQRGKSSNKDAGADRKPPKGKSSGGKGRPEGITGKASSSGGSWLWSLFKLVMFLGLIAGAYVGFTIYRTNKRGRF